VATVTDELETAIRMTGLPQYAAGMDKAAASVQKLWQIEKRREDDQERRSAAFQSNEGGFLGLGKGIGGLLAIDLAANSVERLTRAVQASIRPFAEQEQSIFRMQLVLRNLGRAAEIPALEEFNRQQAEISGQSTRSLSALTALLTQFNLTRDQIQKATPVLIDWSRAVGITLPEAADILGSALRNEKDAIQRYGVDIDLTKTQAQKLDQALKQLNERFAGGAAAQKGTLSGSLTAIAASFEELTAAAGRLFGSSLTTVVNLVNEGIQSLTRLIQEFNKFLEARGILAPLGAATANIGRGDKPATEKTQQRVATAVEGLNDKFVQRVLGGPGNVASRAVTLRDARMALGV
jgi:hypothetical protein